MARGEIIAGLDIGTTKTCAVIAASGPDGLEIIGIGEAPSTGMRKGVVTDLEETVRAIEAATEKAERMAGVHISHVYVGVTGEHIQSTNNRGVVAVSGDEREVIAADVKRVVDASKIINLAADRQIIHALPRHYTIDGQDGVTDPLGMSGGRLEVDTHIITGGSTFIANVLKCVHRAGLEPAGIVFEPLASSAATLALGRKARRLRAARHRRRHDRHRGVRQRRRDSQRDDSGRRQHPHQRHRARASRRRSAEAENVKRTYGSGLMRPDEAEQTFHVKTLDGRSTREVTSAQLRAIVAAARARNVPHRESEHRRTSAARSSLSEVVLTGGGAHLRGIETTAAEIFGLPVRIGVPATIAGLTDSVKQPEYATAVGLVLFGPRGEASPHLNGRSGGTAFAKLWTWFTSIWN